jgi:hypothetical protein
MANRRLRRAIVPAVARIGYSTVSDNGTGLSASGNGQIISYQDNELDGNQTNGAPTGTTTVK